MITVGLLFLVQQFTRYEFQDTWPLLLIAIGAAMLLQHSGFLQSAAGTESSSDKVNHG
jgi:hypothetical protein